MKLTVFFSVVLLFNNGLALAQDQTALVEQFFNAVRYNNIPAADAMIEKFAGIDKEDLKKHLNTEEKAKAFWINVYNAFAQYLLKKNPDLYKDRNDFFSDELIALAGENLSLDDIEHGIIRHSKNKYSLGYMGKLSVSDFEETFRLKKVDYRIHFALNCGAKSCPPVALYDHRRIEEQLEKSTRLYLKNNVRYDRKDEEIFVPRLCLWFKADFGGADGVLEMLRKFGFISEKEDPDLEYLEYDWELSLSNYIDL